MLLVATSYPIVVNLSPCYEGTSCGTIALVKLSVIKCEQFIFDIPVPVRHVDRSSSVVTSDGFSIVYIYVSQMGSHGSATSGPSIAR